MAKKTTNGDEDYWLPDFDLAPFTRFDPRVFKSDDRALDAFMLTLAHAYNDFKNLVWFDDQMKRGKRPASEPQITPYQGQVVGMEEWVGRQMLAILNELLAWLEKGTVHKGAGFARVLNQAQPEARQRWLAVADVAARRTSKHPLAAYLCLIRNKIASHYGDPDQLLKAYDAYFFDGQPSVFSEAALASFGTRHRSTRFYFADAATQEYRVNTMRAGASDKEIQAMVQDVSIALSGVVSTYLGVRAKQLANLKDHE